MEIIDNSGRVLTSSPGLGKEAGRLRVIDANGNLKVTALDIDGDLDADTLDGLDSTAFALSDHVHTSSSMGLHDMITGHTYAGGNALDVFGLAAPSTLAKLTPSSNPGVASAILKSGAAGELGLQKLTTPLVDASGNLTLQPAADLILAPESYMVKAPEYVSVQSDDYTSQTTGWRITHEGAGDFRYLFADEMHVKSFIADLEQALAGGQIICKSVTTLAKDIILPAAGASATLWVKDLPSAENMAVFESGDLVRMRQFSRAAGELIVADAWGVPAALSAMAFIPPLGLLLSLFLPAAAFHRRAR